MIKDDKAKVAPASLKPYQAPKLTEFGSIAVLTKNNTISTKPEGPGQGNAAKKP